MELNETNNYTDKLELIMGLVHIQEAINPECRRAATLILSGFMVVGILLIIPAILQTAVAYFWVRQIYTQSERHRTKDQISVKHMQESKMTEMTLHLFLYRILACSASFTVLVCSTLPQLILVVANMPIERRLDQYWGWCQAIVFWDHATRFFATYLIVVPYIIFFWNFFFTEVISMHRFVMQRIFLGIILSAFPIGILPTLIAVPLLVFRYEKFTHKGEILCYPSSLGTSRFLLFDFISTRILPAIILIVITASFLRWLPRRHYGVFYEPVIFLFLMLPILFVESTIYIFYNAQHLHWLANEYFANSMTICYALYHISFSSTFILATMRSVISEIYEERKARANYLLGETRDSAEGMDRNTQRKHNVLQALQRQFSVAFRWRSECAEDELHFTEKSSSRRSSSDEQPFTKRKEILTVADVKLHYAILMQSAAAHTSKLTADKKKESANDSTSNSTSECHFRVDERSEAGRCKGF